MRLTSVYGMLVDGLNGAQSVGEWQPSAADFRISARFTILIFTDSIWLTMCFTAYIGLVGTVVTCPLKFERTTTGVLSSGLPGRPLSQARKVIW